MLESQNRLSKLVLKFPKYFLLKGRPGKILPDVCFEEENIMEKTQLEVKEMLF